MNRSGIAAPAAAALLALATPASTANVHGEDTTPRAVAKSRLPDALVGAWISVGRSGHVSKAPTRGGLYLFCVGSHWCLTQADARTGVVLAHDGGTYRAKGDKYDDSTEYANPTMIRAIGDTNESSIQIKGDVLTFISVDDPWQDMFKRLKPDAATAESPLAGKLAGAWALVSKSGEIDNHDFKLCADGRWCNARIDPKTGVVVTHHGGTYTFKGDILYETTEYATPDCMNLIGQTFKFDIKFQGDTVTKAGIGNPWNEVWNRVD